MKALTEGLGFKDSEVLHMCSEEAENLKGNCTFYNVSTVHSVSERARRSKENRKVRYRTANLPCFVVFVVIEIDGSYLHSQGDKHS